MTPDQFYQKRREQSARISTEIIGGIHSHELDLLYQNPVLSLETVHGGGGTPANPQKLKSPGRTISRFSIKAPRMRVFWGWLGLIDALRGEEKEEEEEPRTGFFGKPAAPCRGRKE